MTSTPPAKASTVVTGLRDFFGAAGGAGGCRDGGPNLGYLPAVSAAALKKMSTRVRRWRLHLWITPSLEELADAIDPIERGWMHYHRRFYGRRWRPRSSASTPT